jgi:hypothetical protein
MGDILAGLRNYLETDSLLYGFSIRTDRVQDTTVAETSRKFPGYPSTTDIYSLLQELKVFVGGYGGKIMNYPMMNVTQDSGVYLLRVAVPVDRPGVARNGVVFHELPARALFLMADIHGGSWAVREGLRQMSVYLADQQKVLMAIPFVSLITDRLAEPDTTKWVSRINVPFF